MANWPIGFYYYKEYIRDGSSWVGSYRITDTNRTLVVFAPSFRCVGSVESVLFRSNWVRLTASYWNGSGWTTVLSGWEAYKSGKGSASFSFNHNRETEATDSVDSPFHNIWKLDVTMKGKDGSAHGYFDVWWGGIEMMTQNEYTETCEGRKIQYCRPECWDIGNGSYSSVDTCIAEQRPSVFRGNPINSAPSYMSASNIDN